MKETSRTLEIDIDMDTEGCRVTVTDTESSSYVSYDVMVEPNEHPEFNEWIGNEIYSWIEFMQEELDSMEDYDEDE